MDWINEEEVEAECLAAFYTQERERRRGSGTREGRSGQKSVLLGRFIGRTI